MRQSSQVATWSLLRLRWDHLHRARYVCHETDRFEIQAPEKAAWFYGLTYVFRLRNLDPSTPVLIEVRAIPDVQLETGTLRSTSTRMRKRRRRSKTERSATSGGSRKGTS